MTRMSKYFKLLIFERKLEGILMQKFNNRGYTNITKS